MEQSLIEFTNYVSVHHPFLSYGFFFISAVLQILFPPYPGDTVLILEGYLSSRGYFNVFAITVNATIGTFLSCLVLYEASYKLGDRIFDIHFIKKFFSRENFSKLTKWFLKYGSFAIIISKFVPGIGSLTMIAAGTFRASRIGAYAAMVFATVIHNVLLVFLGRVAGNNMEFIKNFIKRYNIVAAVLFIAGCIIYIYIKVSKKSKHPTRSF